MSKKQFLLRTGLIAILAGLVVLTIRYGFGEQVYRLYALPVAIVTILPVLNYTMRNRMLVLRFQLKWRFLLLIPLGLIAVIRIGYWLAFFHSPDLATLMHVAYNQISLIAGQWLRLPELLTLLLGLWFFIRLSFWTSKTKA